MALKVGVAGMRGIGTSHTDSYSKDPLAELVAVCDLVRERADAVAAKFGVKAYSSLAEMLRHAPLDIVDVSTGGFENGSWHFEPAMEAMEAGKHVLVEKPISNDINEARQMVATATPCSPSPASIGTRCPRGAGVHLGGDGVVRARRCSRPSASAAARARRSQGT
jgi:predicted dehydrogenase